MQGVFVTVRATPAVGKDYGFIVVDKADTRAQKMVFQKLPLDTCSNGEAKVHLLEILLCHVQRFCVGDSVCSKTIINGINGFLKIFSFFKLKKEIDGCTNTERMELSWSSFSSLAAKAFAENSNAVRNITIVLDLNFIRLPIQPASFLLSGDASFRILS